MSEFFHDLPDGLYQWVEQTAGGSITRLERHIARREAWVVDITAPDGAVTEGFLRLDRNPIAGSATSLHKEARICESLSKTTIPVPQLLAWSDVHCAALLSRDGGRSDIDKLEDQQRQRAIMEDFITVIARLHRLDVDKLRLGDVLGPKPQTAAELALGDLDLQLRNFKRFLSNYTDPLLTYGVQWLRRHIPTDVPHMALVQGDTGPVNFMFQQDKVSVVVDWEWGHWGDPMEDLGNICVREFWNPSGGLDGLFKLYEQESGLPYQRFSAQYYRIQQNVRGMIPIHAVCANPPEQESLAWYLCYRYVTDRSTCEGIADAMGIAIERPTMPTNNTAPDLLASAAIGSLRRDVLTRTDNAFAKSRAGDAVRLIECMDRQQRFGPALASIETEEIGELMGHVYADLNSAQTALVSAIEAEQLNDEKLLQYLARKTYRDEWLFAPAVALYPERQWSSLD
ncbi:phosphotransferase family protein [Halieaceae bacterium IMCC14734]|uniref:Phosphotransferase family protein n=1 Tax=Candidatus Litorirhabdus singularis TaxID=2518993 RepID=A0ABT3TLE9_9GAMM|nr:phosphotransferase family protein [Candidatus Litorirhabdus singularis]MCX2983154.1 phosphotransferase family protein [Candidatus Litorirhabdus singularis]